MPVPDLNHGLPDPIRFNDGISVFVTDLDRDGTVPPDRIASVLSPDEMARADRFHFPRDRDRFMRGRAFVRVVLGRSTGAEPGSVVFSLGPNGKPELAHDGPCFNLSHSDRVGVLAVSRSGPVGVDVEMIDRKGSIRNLIPRCFDAKEAAVLDPLPDRDLREPFFAFWTAKEARMKITGQGMSLPPRSISLALRDGWPVGYRSDPGLGLGFVETGVPGTKCCIAYELSGG